MGFLVLPRDRIEDSMGVLVFWVLWTIAGIVGLVLYAHLADPSRPDVTPDIVVMILCGPVGWAMLLAVLAALYSSRKRKARV